MSYSGDQEDIVNNHKASKPRDSRKNALRCLLIPVGSDNAELYLKLNDRLFRCAVAYSPS